MLSHSTLDRFKVSKEELTKLGEEFNSEAMPILKNLYNTSFWILLNNKFAEKIIKQTFLETIENCNVTKNSAKWDDWIFRIWMREILDFYSKKENDTQTIFDFIDHAEIIFNELASFTNSNKIKSDSSEKELINSLEMLPSVLRIPMIMKEIYPFNYEKIAELIDVPVGVIATRIFRARKLLYISGKKNFHFEDEKKKWANREPTKKIFELRKCAFLVDNEFNQDQKSAFTEVLKNNPNYETELLIQGEVKKLLNNCSAESALIVQIESKIERKVRKKFNQQ